MNTEIVKVRASNTGVLMIDPKGKSNADKYDDALKSLEAKIQRLDSLSDKAIKTKEKLIPEIEALELTIKKLEPLKDIVELSESAKTLAKKMYWENEHGIKKEYTSKYFDKGNENEPVSIALAQRVNAWERIDKNEKHYTNEYLTGTPDLVYTDLLPDIKTSWTALTFPIFEDELPDNNYYWQVQSYLALTGIKKAVITYCLVDTPELLVMDEIYKYARINGLIETPADVELNIRHAHNYSRLPEGLRVKNFYIDRDDEAINRLYKKVEAFSIYYNSLVETANELKTKTNK